MQENRGKSFRKSYWQGSGVCGQGEMDKENDILLLALFTSVPQNSVPQFCFRGYT